ncbi:MAG: DUF429 domain-containing protein [Candidatus Manganitrophus sp. SA1]|nr:DUF429 domain-containing protein [Candidatus Manganitrophus morganii]
MNETRFEVWDSFKDILNLTPSPRQIAIDIPIGLLNERQVGGRECDRQARRALGRPRASSVFSPPVHKILPAQEYFQTRGFGISRQAFGIFPKIREVDEQMTPELQKRVYEVHPELSFWRLAGRAMQYNKKTPEGREERLQVLSKTFPGVREKILGGKAPGFHYDDMIDAHVAAWTGMRIENGAAEPISKGSFLDSKGLRMEIWY